MSFSMPDLIEKKKNGLELTREEIFFFIDAVVKGKIDECQTGAMLMAMFLKDLNFRETVDLTKAMISSGETLRFENFGKEALVDKHSTGGVGDKISLVLAPALAAVGLKVPMISGRGLGHTGGTLDKLESIPGFQVNLTGDQMNRCLEKAGCFICGTTMLFVPADSVLYQMRDLTSTVENVSLIASSIISKKAAEGIGTLMLDVKFGRGAMMNSAKEAEEFARVLVNVGNELGLNTEAVISEMNVPIGKYVGNSLEIIEAVMCLRNEVNNFLPELTKLLGGVILMSKGLAKSVEEGKVIIENTFKNKSGLKHFEKMLVQQGVTEEDARNLCAGHFWKVLPKASRVTRLRSPKKGVVVDIDALKIGRACRQLEGGRLTSDSKIDHSSGIILLKEVGESIERTEPWVEIHFSTDRLPPNVENLISSSLTVKESPAGTTFEAKAVRLTKSSPNL